ncbi:hypothetical protein [Cohnella yongneupensis]|uniref:Uncharacterized protein n=1 Tax=Cohnella yongneupensis TaxID=425006 RepID=A0ABW0QUY6_9BACL
MKKFIMLLSLALIMLGLVIPINSFAATAYSGSSGKAWYNSFPTSTSTTDLDPSFKPNVDKFIEALKAAGVKVTINASKRPAERAWLMHYSWLIYKNKISPKDVPVNTDINIQWVHPNDDKKYTKSKQAAKEMVMAYEISVLDVAPALNSYHISGKAIDMNTTWTTKTITIKDANGKDVKISSGKKDGTNPELIKVGATYGVIHYSPVSKDKVHWSTDGH